MRHQGARLLSAPPRLVCLNRPSKKILLIPAILPNTGVSELMTADTPKNGTKPPRILIVDDDAGQRSLLDSFLRSQGFETVTVSSGERALEILRDQDIGMMISDVRMPGLSGLETLRRGRQGEAGLPIFLVAAYSDIR